VMGCHFQNGTRRVLRLHIDLSEPESEIVGFLRPYVRQYHALIVSRKDYRSPWPVNGAGSVIMPAIVSFYHQPKTIDDLVTQYVCRVLAQIGLPQPKQFTWKGSDPPAGKARSA